MFTKKPVEIIGKITRAIGRGGVAGAAADARAKLARDAKIRREKIYRERLAEENTARRKRLAASRAKTPGAVFVVAAVDTEGPTAIHAGSDWAKVEAEVGRVMSDGFRARFTDSAGQRPRVSWFILDFVGYSENPHGVEMGREGVFGRYRSGALSEKALAAAGDETAWHYHHPALGGVWQPHWNPDWQSNSTYEEILNRRLLDHGWFPAAYRAGGTVMSNAQSLWLERWIPFDYSSRAPYGFTGICDWSRADTGWTPYHPAQDDYQRPGGMKRWTARSLDIENPDWFTRDEALKAFLTAAEGRDCILSFFTHDYKELHDNLARGFEIVTDAAKEFPDAPLCFAGAREAMARLTGPDAPPELQIDAGRREIAVECRGEFFQAQPWTALKLETGEYVRVDTAQHDGSYSWRAPAGSPGIIAAAAAATSPSGLVSTATAAI